jgi:hypothetical protein
MTTKEQTIQSEIIETDLTVVEKMATEMAPYLVSECTHWVMGNSHMPLLTIGGYLMRQDRLLVLCKTLQAAQQKRLQQAIIQFEQALIEQVVRFEERTHQELHARLSEWVGYLRRLGVYRSRHDATYPTAVNTRVMIAAMMDKLQRPPYQLDIAVLDEVTTLDRRLRGQWVPGRFVLPFVWQPAYPPEKYWWLYGCPK